MELIRKENHLVDVTVDGVSETIHYFDVYEIFMGIGKTSIYLSV